MAFSLTRVKAALSGDAYKWLLEMFARYSKDNSGNITGLQGPDNEVIGQTKLVTSSRTLAFAGANSDLGAMLANDTVTDYTLTVPNNAQANAGCSFLKNSTGKITIQGDTNVSINGTVGGNVIIADTAPAARSLVYVSNNKFAVI